MSCPVLHNNNGPCPVSRAPLVLGCAGPLPQGHQLVPHPQGHGWRGAVHLHRVYVAGGWWVAVPGILRLLGLQSVSKPKLLSAAAVPCRPSHHPRLPSLPEYLDGGAGCTPDLRNASMIANMEQAIADGDVVWNAMPFRLAHVAHPSPFLASSTARRPAGPTPGTTIPTPTPPPPRPHPAPTPTPAATVQLLC
jgi:hypothetical protein